MLFVAASAVASALMPSVAFLSCAMVDFHNFGSVIWCVAHALFARHFTYGTPVCGRGGGGW